MIEKIVSLLFRWQPLRVAIFSEVDWYNSITRTMNDPEQMKIATSIWCDTDGWRGWNIKDNGSYYFHDTPENSLGSLMDILMWGEDEKQIATS